MENPNYQSSKMLAEEWRRRLKVQRPERVLTVIKGQSCGKSETIACGLIGQLNHGSEEIKTQS